MIAAITPETQGTLAPPRTPPGPTAPTTPTGPAGHVRRQFEGRVTSLGYRAPDDSFRVFQISLSTGVAVSVSQQAASPELEIGDIVAITGAQFRHPRYGDQIKASDVARKMPSTANGIAKVIAGKKFAGIGQKTATRLAQKLGSSLAAALDAGDPDGAIQAVIGAKKAKALLDAWAAEQRLHQTHSMLAGYGVGPAIRDRIFKAYDDVGKMLAVNPFRLVTEIEGVGFPTADALARSAGLQESDPLRLAAGLDHALELAATRGHSGLNQTQLVDAATKLLTGCKREEIETALERTVAGGVLRCNRSGLYQRRATAALEVRVAKYLKRAAKRRAPIDRDRLDDLINDPDHLNLSDEQCAAVRAALSNPLSVITGGPGTGKTQTVRTVIALAEILLGSGRSPGRVLALAPTGRAADRLSQATGRPASTIHRGLAWDPVKGGFMFDENDPLEADIVIIDETTMVDTRLMDAVLRALGDARLVLVGDVDQLPSVDPGRVLLDVIESGICPVARLTKIFRQAKGSAIAAGSNMIRQGKRPDFGSPGQSELVFLAADDAEAAAARIVDLVAIKLPAHLGVAATSIQILSPARNSAAGTIALNTALQQKLNPHAPISWTPTKPAGRQTVRLGDGSDARIADKVICTENNYDQEIFNGDVGTIIGFDETHDGARLSVEFGGRRVEFPRANWGKLGLAYALTIHKSQGSEYDVVVIPVTLAHRMMLQRPLIYTAASRAAKLCIFVGTLDALDIALKTINLRQTGLLDLLKSG